MTGRSVLPVMAVLALAAGGCAGEAPPPPRSGDSVAGDLHRAQRSSPFRLYSLGPSFGSLPLTGVDGLYVIYGTCTPGPSSEGGCAPPLQLQLASVC